MLTLQLYLDFTRVREPVFHPRAELGLIIQADDVRAGASGKWEPKRVCQRG